MGVLRYPPAQNAVQKTLAANLDTGVTSSLTLNNTTNINNKPGVCVIDRIDSSGSLKSASDREFVAYTGVSGSTLTGLTRNIDNSSSDQDHATGAIVEFIADVVFAQAILDALDGTSSGVVTLTAPTITSPAVTTPKITTSINDSNGNEVIKTPATTSAVNEITITNAATGNAPQVSPTGGDSNVGLDMKMKGTGKYRRPTVVEVPVGSASSSLATGDGQGFFRVPDELNGMNLTGVAAAVYTAGTTGTCDIQIRNKTQSADMLTTKLTIDSTETDSSTAATAAVIDTANDDVATGDIIAIDIDAVQTTAAKGLVVQMRFELP